MYKNTCVWASSRLEANKEHAAVLIHVKVERAALQSEVEAAVGFRSLCVEGTALLGYTVRVRVGVVVKGHGTLIIAYHGSVWREQHSDVMLVQNSILDTRDINSAKALSVKSLQAFSET